uniref:Uncharacterized protein n=1 Tax=Melanothamnus harveyi TaxID=397005 RepID=A0A1Z1MI91_MELHR|nr:hypothetical protein [Melanothamnus harveyi]ARW65461.1 hypothetical protein [Melanothamnus harveyi]
MTIILLFSFFFYFVEFIVKIFVSLIYYYVYIFWVLLCNNVHNLIFSLHLKCF